MEYFDKLPKLGDSGCLYVTVAQMNTLKSIHLCPPGTLTQEVDAASPTSAPFLLAFDV
jgi:hypothetical protein